MEKSNDKEPRHTQTRRKRTSCLEGALQSGDSIRKLELSIEELQEALSEGGEKLDGIIPICSQCQRVRDRDGRWHHVSLKLISQSESCFSHGLCEECATLLFGKDVVYG